MSHWRLERHATLASTSDLCTARAHAGEPAGLAVLAATQTAGRGSRGRHWLAPAGNLNLSLLLRPTLPAAEAGVFALLAGVATAEAIAPIMPSGRAPILKWPNDILLGNAKLGGILIDAAPTGQILDWLVIGIGLNLREAPAIPGRATTSLAAHGVVLTADAAANAVLDRIEFWLEALNTSGPAAIHRAWLALAHPVGTPLAVRAAHGTINGFFEGLSSTGALLLSQNGNVTRINTGEVLLATTAA